MPQQDCPQFIGVDVAKLTLAIQFPDQLWSTTNSAQGHAAFLARIRSLGSVQVICEATGGYERALVCALHQAGILPAPVADWPRPTRSMPGSCATTA